MYSRRSIMSIALSASLAARRARAADGDVSAQEATAWIESNKSQGYFDPLPAAGVQKGSKVLAPDTEEVKKAAAFLQSVPSDLSPLATALWMIDHLDRSEIMEWPPDSPDRKNPANPIIIMFFSATATKPYMGDQTAWCAAFANWILLRSGLERTNSAGSASFRGKWKSTTDPSPGDIVVFANKKDAAFGHVGFFNGWINRTDGRMSLCGGNQKDRLGIDRWIRDKHS